MKSHVRVWEGLIVAVVASGFVALHARQQVLAQTESESAQDTILHAVAQGYMENRERLDSFKCTFRVVRGKAASVEAAVTGGVYNVSSQTGIWARSGAVTFYQLKCDDAMIPAQSPNSVGLTHVECLSETILSDGAWAMQFSSDMRVGGIRPAPFGRAGIQVTPTSFGKMGRDEMRALPELIQDAKAECHVESIKDGLITIRAKRLEHDGTSEWLLDTEWTVDAQRGFVPAALLDFRGEPRWKYKTIVTEVRELENGAFVPMRSVSYSNPEAGTPIDVFLIIVDAISLNNGEASQLSVEVPKGAKIFLQHDGRSMVTTRVSGAVCAADVNGWRGRCEAALKRRNAGLPGEEVRFVTHRKWPWASTIALVLMLTCVWVLWRYRASR